MINKLIDDFKKSNKIRRLKIANKNGFNTSEEYLSHLQKLLQLESSDLNKKADEIKTIHNVFLLDASGSMYGNKYNNAISGINKIIKSIENDKLTNNTISVIEFSSFLRDGHYIHHWLESNIFSKPYLGASGGTPFYKTLKNIVLKLLDEEKLHNCNVLLNVFTDGNDTDYWTKPELNELSSLLKSVQEHNKFTITFIGTSRDVKNCIDKLSLDESNTLVHNNTGNDVIRVYEQTISARQSYSSNVSKGINVSTGFYKTIN